MPLRIFAVALAALPIAFGVLRLITTGEDVRYLLSALASLAGASAIIVRSPARNTFTTGLTLAAASLGAALAAACAALLGARSASAIAVVAVAFGVCSAGGLTLWILASSDRRSWGQSP
jgi:hypothetical protein